MSRTRVGIGVAIVGIASYLAVDPGERADLAVRALAASWPYLLAIFAVAATLAAIVDLRRLAGAMLIAATAATALLYRWASPSVLGYLPFAAAAVGAGIALSGQHSRLRDRIVSIAWTSRWAPHGDLPARLTVTCVLGALYLDLRGTSVPSGTKVNISTYVGYVRLKVPVQWNLGLDGDGSVLVTVDERGRRDKITNPSLRLQTGGMIGTIVVDRC
ncbi:hypothetical protein [Mangrovihabitans endophyticus]|uniref:Cell wall-active antibiotics response 4TMS YvqF n=1 Tax=Mangrovihabitans endophyticus TaxID=1751298 RepID=A0A8J3FSL5_9ACTN|nr:hypothetical protein [Mangrovihabitans endophyticus]GGL20162.1 hypothetical protein GCM10012284_63500 [Mangrovihabitans endophyticus]